MAQNFVGNFLNVSSNVSQPNILKFSQRNKQPEYTDFSGQMFHWMFHGENPGFAPGVNDTAESCMKFQ